MAIYLRERFAQTEESIRNYAGLSGTDATMIRRYLHGERIPPSRFVTKLLTHAAEKQGRALELEELKAVQNARVEAFRAVERARLQVEEIETQAEIAEAQRVEVDERIQNMVDLIEALVGEMGLVKGEARALESSWTKKAIEAAPRAELVRFEVDRKALVRAEEDIREEIDRLKVNLEEAEAAKEVAGQRCQVLESALVEAQRVYALVADMVGRPDLSLPQSIVAYVDNRRLRWGGIVGMGIGPLILYGWPAYLGVMFQMVSAHSVALRIATLVGLIIPVWFAFGIRRLERAGLPRPIHLIWAVVATVIIFFVFTLLPYQIFFSTAMSDPADFDAGGS
ncbi:hypothetical protein ACQEUU_17870 [Nonomuraea sp. CA-218870]|uniref:hypothetical protein n=1 Tax=Nonomuraea sp. CA-218870 TaxID=3239998 RepID=UPI003D8FBDFA